MLFLTLLFVALLIGLFCALGTLVLKILYTFCIGLPIALCLVVLGVIFCITIIGIPVGLGLFKAAGFVLVPFH